jgi:predicted RNase H-like HicB family nuclease
MKRDRYVYPALLGHAMDGISIEFPDLPGCLPCAHSVEEAFRNARQALGLHLRGMEQDGDVIPAPTPIDMIRTKRNQVAILVDVWMPMIRDAVKNRAVKKTLTIPKWLDDLAVEHGVNFSHVLQEALKRQLNILQEHH